VHDPATTVLLGIPNIRPLFDKAEQKVGRHDASQQLGDPALHDLKLSARIIDGPQALVFLLHVEMLVEVLIAAQPLQLLLAHEQETGERLLQERRWRGDDDRCGYQASIRSQVRIASRSSKRSIAAARG
jgi:hypothetical protein